MMRSSLIVLFLTFATSLACAQPVKTIDIGNNGSAFALHGNVAGRVRTFSSDAEARKIVEDLLSSMGLPLRFEIRAAAVSNAAAILQRDGSRLILYNTIFMDQIKAKTGRYWSLISIMAHEIGHHLAFHLQKDMDNKDAELEADYFSGYILAKQGASLDDALAAIREIATDTESKTHPGRADRLQAIAAGWKNASAGEKARPTTVARQSSASSTNRRPEAAPQTRHIVSPRRDARACSARQGTVYCVSSFLPTTGVNKSNYGPASLMDGSDETAWVEGRSGKTDVGVGEWLLLDWGEERLIKALTLKNGYAKSGSLFQKNGRVAQIKLRFSNGKNVVADIKDTRSAQTIQISQPQRAKWVQIEITDAHRGSKYADTAINEIRAHFD